MKIYFTSRLSGRLAPIFYFNCEHFLFVRKSLRIHKFNKSRILFQADFFEILIIHNRLWIVLNHFYIYQMFLKKEPGSVVNRFGSIFNQI